MARPPRRSTVNRIASVAHAYDRAAGLIRSASSLDQAFQEATLLADELRRLESDATTMRGRLAAQILERYDLSISELGERLNLSKSSAARLLRYANRRDDEKSPESTSPPSTPTVTNP